MELSKQFTYKNGRSSSDSSCRVEYFGVFDGEPDVSGWNKSTVDYAIKYSEKLKNFISSRIIKYSDSVIDDTDELYQEVLLELYKAEDFRAFDLDENSKLSSTIANYVYKRTEYVISTFRDKMCNIRRKRCSNVVRDEDGESIEIFEFIPDGKDDYEYLLYDDVESFLKPLEPRRFEFGFDLFQVLYISIAANKMKINSDKVFKLLALLNSKEVYIIKQWYLELLGDEDIESVVLALNKCKDITPLEKYVFGINQLKTMLKNLSEV